LYITLYFKYITNFKPQLSYVNNCNSKIFTKNFIIIFLILEYFSKKWGGLGFSYICLPLKTKPVVFLRAPNRSKSSQISLTLIRYSILLTLKISKLGSFVFKITPQFINFYLKSRFRGIRFFESNYFYNQNIKFLINYNYNLK